MLDFWRHNHVYAQSLRQTTARGTFILHDGPPFSNGNIHIGHAFNKILKDVTTRFRTMQGYKCPYVPGWDNNGLPIEVLVAKEFREKKQTPTRPEIRARCREVATEWVGKQSEQFQRLGIRGDWEHPYLTMTPEMAARSWTCSPTWWTRASSTGACGPSPGPWWTRRRWPTPRSSTPTAPTRPSTSASRCCSDPDGIFGADADQGSCYTIIWTTTPWTIPANVAVAVGPDIEYVVAEHEGRRYLVAAERLGATMAAAELQRLDRPQDRAGPGPAEPHLPAPAV